ncbi:MAG: FprA family A-type flavoprotein [Oscillospiraceae bacterium]|jgi:flavorubredoxin|nr:FprA family A-type flavoprotein [Oscillospiraceae bacterium]
MHCVRNVTPDLYWVGANDRRTPLFENIHPIPQGVSYNSYLLLDEKTVLFDCVDWSAAPQLLENIDYLLKGRDLDYIVLHHLEPDHGAGLWAVLQRWPHAKLISSLAAQRFMDQFGFSPFTGERIVAKEGERFSFGRHAITFYAAPMVHWPDVMVSFEETEGILFTADAFGTFGALNGKLFNDELDFPHAWLPEARRYYANIVGKYGPPVQALLSKAAALGNKLKLLCPLHGPVWRTDLSWFMGKYDLWSRYQPEDNAVLLVYGSMYGGTEQAAEALAIALTEQGVPVSMYDVSTTPVSHLIAESFRCSHIVLASVTYNMDFFPPVRDYLEDMKALALQNRTFAVMENGTWNPAAAKLTAAFVTGELTNCALLEPKVVLKSAPREDQSGEIQALSAAIAAHLQS